MFEESCFYFLYHRCCPDSHLLIDDRKDNELTSVSCAKSSEPLKPCIDGIPRSKNINDFKRFANITAQNARKGYQSNCVRNLRKLFNYSNMIISESFQH